MPHSVVVMVVLPPETGNTLNLLPRPHILMYTGICAGIIAPTLAVRVAGALIAYTQAALATTLTFVLLIALDTLAAVDVTMV